MREAHWRALAAVTTLEGEKEQLSWSIIQGQPEAHAHSWSWDHHRRSGGWNRRQCWVQPEESPAPFVEHSSPWRGPGSGEDEEAELAVLDFDLEAPLELGPEVNHFLQETAGSSEEEGKKRSSPEPPVEEYKSWVTWRAWVHDMPGWWQELAKVPKIKTTRN